MRIASLSPAVTEILFALGIGEQIVCTDQFSNFPEEAKAIPHVRDMIKIDPEEIRTFQPEIVFLGTSIQTKLAHILRAEGFSVVHDDPRTIADIYAWIRSIGTIVDRGREAEDLVLRMQKGFNEVKKKAAVMRKNASRRDGTPCRLYIEEWPAFAPCGGASAGKHDLPFTSGNWVPEIARIAGGEQMPIPIPKDDGGRDGTLCRLHQEGRLSVPVTLEEVEAWNPDLIVISWCGAGTLAPKELLLNRPGPVPRSLGGGGWDRLTAIQKGHVRVIDDSLLNRPGPRLVEGAQRLYGWMFEMLH